MTKLPYGLSGEIYRSPMPYSAFDPLGKLIEEFKEYQIHTVVVLNSKEECSFRTGEDLFQVYEEEGLQIIHCPIDDFDVPELPILKELVRQIKLTVDLGKHLNVHCFAGIGRTGLVLTCLAKIVFGISSQQALAWVRQFVPEAVQTELQWRMVQEFNL